MLTNYKTAIVAAVATVGLLVAAFLYGGHVERLEADKEIADLEKQYAQHEAEALRRAEAVRQEQEQKFLTEIAAVKRSNADIAADAQRVRKQFESIAARRSATLEQCNNRAGRCERLLSEAYELAGECESLLRDRDARLGAMK